VDDVDDSVPSAVSDAASFYRVFGPVFARNAKCVGPALVCSSELRVSPKLEYAHVCCRWFQTQPAPMLGDDKTSLDQVKALYNFWSAALCTSTSLSLTLTLSLSCFYLRFLTPIACRMHVITPAHAQVQHTNLA
jgi:hypothetical protein